MDHGGLTDESLARTIDSVYVSFPKDDPASGFYAVGDVDLRPLFLNQVAYLTGNFAAIEQTYSQLDDDAARLIAALSALPAAISLGDWEFYLELEDWVNQFIGDNNEPCVSTYAEHVLAHGFLGGRAPQRVANWIKEGDFSNLHPKARIDAYLQRADYLGIIQNYELMLATAQMALYLASLITHPDETSITGINLRIRAAIAYFHLDREGEARAWLSDTMDLALRHGFITPFAENIVKLGGLIEDLLKQNYPDWHDPVVELASRIIPNWIEYRNRLALRPFSSELSIQEMEIAYCAARGETTTEIAKHFHLSVGTINNKLQSIYNKLTITSARPRKELAFLINAD